MQFLVYLMVLGIYRLLYFDRPTDYFFQGCISVLNISLIFFLSFCIVFLYYHHPLPFLIDVVTAKRWSCIEQNNTYFQAR